MRESKLNETAAAKAVRGMDYPVDAVFDVPSIRITGMFEAMAENCRGILFYSSDRLVLDMGDYTATIDGRNLVINELSSAQLSVDGEIQIICFEGREHSDG